MQFQTKIIAEAHLPDDILISKLNWFISCDYTYTLFLNCVLFVPHQDDPDAFPFHPGDISVGIK